MALGSQLREARMRLGLTTSEIAAATRMKVQIVEAIEREDFSSIAAPIYGKGFIRLFAERVGINPGPLVEEYVAVFVNRTEPSLQKTLESAAGTTEPVPSEAGEEDGPAQDDLFSGSQAESVQDRAVPAGGERERTGPPGIGASVSGALSSAKTLCVSVFRKTMATVCETVPDLRMDFRKIRFGEAPLKTVVIAVGILVILVLIFSALSRYVRAPRPERAGSGADLQLAIDPPDPYME